MKLTIWLISVIGTFGGGEGDDELPLSLRGINGGGVIGWTFTLHSLELRFGEIRAGKLKVFVHCDKLRTILWFFFMFFFCIVRKISLFLEIFLYINISSGFFFRQLIISLEIFYSFLFIHNFFTVCIKNTLARFLQYFQFFSIFFFYYNNIWQYLFFSNFLDTIQIFY